MCLKDTCALLRNVISSNTTRDDRGQGIRWRRLIQEQRCPIVRHLSIFTKASKATHCKEKVSHADGAGSDSRTSTAVAAVVFCPAERLHLPNSELRNLSLWERFSSALEHVFCRTEFANHMFLFHITSVQSYMQKMGQTFRSDLRNKKSQAFFLLGQTHQGIVSEQIPEREYANACVCVWARISGRIFLWGF